MRVQGSPPGLGLGLPSLAPELPLGDLILALASPWFVCGLRAKVECIWKLCPRNGGNGRWPFERWGWSADGQIT